MRFALWPIITCLLQRHPRGRHTTIPLALLVAGLLSLATASEVEVGFDGEPKTVQDVLNVQDAGRFVRQAAELGSVDAVDSILRALPDTAAQLEALASFDDDGLTSIHIAAKHGHFPVVALLTSLGACLICPDHRGRTPLHIAAEHGQLESIELLINAGSSVSASDMHGHQPLHSAVIAGHSAAVRALLREAKDSRQTHHQDVALKTALHHAAERGHVYIAKLLLKAGSPVDMPDENNETPHSLALKNGHEQIVRVLEAASAKAKSDKSAGARRGQDSAP